LTALDTSVVAALTSWHEAHDHVLLTRDARAVRTYERLGVAYELLR